MLDVGCGGGLLVESFARLGGTVTGIDPSIENIGIASSHASLGEMRTLLSCIFAISNSYCFIFIYRSKCFFKFFL